MRWGEITLKECSKSGRTKFDRSKSFSIENCQFVYNLEQLEEILRIAVDMTQDMSYEKLKEVLLRTKRKPAN